MKKKKPKADKENQLAREKSFRGWMDLQELTAYVSASERTIRGWIYSQALPAFRIGGKTFVNRREFDLWVRAHAVKR
jgi:excisionase family DNA binding protein